MKFIKLTMVSLTLSEKGKEKESEFILSKEEAKKIIEEAGTYDTVEPYYILLANTESYLPSQDDYEEIVLDLQLRVEEIESFNSTKDGYTYYLLLYVYLYIHL